MRSRNIIILSLIGVIACSVLCIGFLSNRSDFKSVSNNENVSDVNIYNNQIGCESDYWESTPIEEIRTSILAYIDNMMDLTLDKLEDFKKENNESKIRLYENEVKRLNKILNNVTTAKTKQDLREAMQVRHKNNV